MNKLLIIVLIVIVVALGVLLISTSLKSNKVDTLPTVSPQQDTAIDALSIINTIGKLFNKKDAE